MKTLLILLLIAAPASAQSTREHVDQGLMLGSLSMSSIAIGLTMTCTSAGTCRELNPAMAKLLGDSPTRTVVTKTAINAATTYAVWRLTKGKSRTLILGALFAVNTWDAVHDIRHARRLER